MRGASLLPCPANPFPPSACGLRACSSPSARPLPRWQPPSPRARSRPTATPSPAPLTARPAQAQRRACPLRAAAPCPRRAARRRPPTPPFTSRAAQQRASAPLRRPAARWALAWTTCRIPWAPLWCRRGRISTLGRSHRPLQAHQHRLQLVHPFQTLQVHLRRLHLRQRRRIRQVLLHPQPFLYPTRNRQRQRDLPVKQVSQLLQ